MVTSVPVIPMAMPMSAARVVDAVASHGHDLSASFPRTYDAQLVLGRDAGVDRDLLDHIGQIGVAQSVELLAGQGAVGFAREAQLAGDRHRRGRVIAGDHHWSDTRHLALSDRSLGFLAGRVDHAD